MSKILQSLKYKYSDRKFDLELKIINNEYSVWVDVLHFGLIPLFDWCFKEKTQMFSKKQFKMQNISVLMKYECDSIVSNIDVLIGIRFSNIIF